jgi:predicted transcriptional regulator
MDILMSIRPVWVERIRAGEKRAELRRRPVPAQTARIFVYASNLKVGFWPPNRPNP